MKMSRVPITVCLMMLAGVVAMLLPGCARGGEEQPPVVPEKVLDFVIRFASGVMDNFYYYVAIDADGDDGLDGPLPVVAGPRWENGWGSGSFTHYVEYNQGRYELYKAQLVASLTTATGGVSSIAGVPDSTDAGTHQLTITQIDLGAVAVSGAGMITAAANTGFQSAGEIAIQTDAAGQTVAGGVSYTAAADGGRSLTAQEQAQIDALNAGGVALQTDSLQALGIELTLGAAAAGTQTLTIGQTTAQVQNSFESTSVPSYTTTTTSSLNANSATATANPPIPGVTMTCSDFVLNETAIVELERSVAAELIGPPYEYQDPGGGSTLRFTIDVSKLGANVNNVSINIVTTTELIFDPNITLPNENVYDGLGYLGNDYFTISLNEYRTIKNSDGLFVQEGAGENTLEGPASENGKNAVDIVDWEVTLRRLR